ncbi:hypothetical protein [Legionella nagasakiensis]|uniref:hypothetical protein n=1 Tax=Legionella nagasakiensis TaxID=535290 RepID=UPI0010569AE8|nr:hypothetical protein [Legionella nagasakiensis]
MKKTKASEQDVKKPIKLHDITTLTDEKLFQSRLKSVIEKAQKDKDYLQHLKQHPIQALNEANLNIVSNVNIKVVTDTSDAASESGKLILFVPVRGVSVEELNQVTGGGIDPTWGRTGSNWTDHLYLSEIIRA